MEELITISSQRSIITAFFDSNLCYAYSNNLFFPVKVANKGLYTSGTRQLGFWYCDNDNAQWSGNLLNYVTTSRMDAVKRVLIGGERQTSGGQPPKSTDLTLPV